MQKILYPLPIIAALLLSACTSVAEQVMPPLKYQQPINFHVAKNAYLYWNSGQEHSSTQPTYIAANNGIIGALVSTAIDTELRKRNPGRYTFTYGKAQQAIFMTSLKDTLEQNQAFKQVSLTTEPQPLNSQNTLITINFKSTRVAEMEENYKIILDVELIIKTGKKSAFKRTYFVESQAKARFTSNIFKDQQVDASQQLLDKVVAGIKQWQEQLNS